MIFSLKIKNVQSIIDFKFSFNLHDFDVHCLVGMNGTGKTTIIRAIRNLISSETFKATASPYIFNENSEIEYAVDGEIYLYKYNSVIRTLDTKKVFPNELKNSFHVELAMPHGARFSHFSNLSKNDADIRAKIIKGDYTSPDGLIALLSEIYVGRDFSSLKQIDVSGKPQYCILLDELFYIREDYMSSGEYFVINLYKQIIKGGKFVFIDEIDISLDPSAQVRLLGALKRLCKELEVFLFFTTHSLVIMKCMEDKNLYYLSGDDKLSAREVSYSYVKSVLFGFKGYDKYILTEDKMLTKFIEYCIQRSGKEYIKSLKTIYIGGASNTIDLMRRNSIQEFFSESKNVCCILDGDKVGDSFINEDDKIIFSPLVDIEDYLYSCYCDGTFKTMEPIFQDNISEGKKPKSYYNQIKKRGAGHVSDERIFDFILATKKDEVSAFVDRIDIFLDD